MLISRHNKPRGWLAALQIPPTYMKNIRPLKIADTVNVYALLLAFENLWYHIVNRCLKSPPAHFKPSLSQHTFCRCHRFYSQFYPPHIKSPSHLFHLNREVCSINAVDLSFWKRFDWYGTIRNSWLFSLCQLLLIISKWCQQNKCNIFKLLINTGRHDE